MATPNALFLSGAVLTAEQQNNFPFGLVTSQTLATTFTTTSVTPVDITGLSVTFTALASRKYLIVAMFNVFPSVVDTGTVFINNGATALAEGFSIPKVGAITTTSTITMFTIQTPGAGSVTYKTQAATQAGTSTVYGTSTRASLAARMFVLDIGTA
jgi:hypothetical protein